MRIIKKIILIVIVIILLLGISYAWRAFPILTGYGAKTICSCVMLAGRDPDDVIAKELSPFPISLGTFKVNFKDSSATGNIFGLAAKKAVFRKGLGCTLLNEIDEEEIRKQNFTIASTPLINPDTIPWPFGNKLSDAVPAGVNFEKLNDVIENAFEEPGPKKRRRTRSILIVYDGQLIAEKYTDGFDKNSMQMGWSMSKSIVNAMIGILVKQGKLTIEQPAPVDLWKNDDRKKITINNLLHASSGLEWVERYGGPSDATNMLFKKKDMGLFAAQHALEFKPEEVFEYSSGTSNLLSWIIRQAVGDTTYYRFPYELLFYKIGMLHTTMEPDAGGTFVGSSYTFGTARDWARFGLLYLNDGWFNGEQILPDGWVKYSTTPAPAAPMGEYGAQFWLNAGTKDSAANRIFPDVPTDLYWADGFEGQNVFILPSKKLVIVKLSLSQGDYLDDNKFLADVIETLP